MLPWISLFTTAYERDAGTALTTQIGTPEDTSRVTHYWLDSGDLNFASLALELVLWTTTLSYTSHSFMPLESSWKKRYFFVFLSWNFVYWVWEMLEADVWLPPQHSGARLLGVEFLPCSCVVPTRSIHLTVHVSAALTFLSRPHCWHGTVALDVAVMEQHILSVKFGL